MHFFLTVTTQRILSLTWPVVVKFETVVPPLLMIHLKLNIQNVVNKEIYRNLHFISLLGRLLWSTLCWPVYQEVIAINCQVTPTWNKCHFRRRPLPPPPPPIGNEKLAFQDRSLRLGLQIFKMPLYPTPPTPPPPQHTHTRNLYTDRLPLVTISDPNLERRCENETKILIIDLHVLTHSLVHNLDLNFTAFLTACTKF